jgi:hypothetical protein
VFVKNNSNLCISNTILLITCTIQFLSSWLVSHYRMLVVFVVGLRPSEKTTSSLVVSCVLSIVEFQHQMLTLSFPIMVYLFISSILVNPSLLFLFLRFLFYFTFFCAFINGLVMILPFQPVYRWMSWYNLSTRFLPIIITLEFLSCIITSGIFSYHYFPEISLFPKGFDLHTLISYQWFEQHVSYSTCIVAINAYLQRFYELFPCSDVVSLLLIYVCVLVKYLL